MSTLKERIDARMDAEPPRSAALFEAPPTREELNDAFGLLRDRGVDVICDRSLSCIAEAVRGNPPHAPDRYTGFELALSQAVLVLRAEVERRGERIAELERGATFACEQEPCGWCAGCTAAAEHYGSESGDES